MPQSINRLENRKSKNDKVSRRVWKAVETSAREVGLGETEGGRRREEKKKRKKQKKGKMVEVKRIAKKWEIWDKEEEAVESEAEARKLVLEKFHPWIKVFRKKQSERIPTRKV